MKVPFYTFAKMTDLHKRDMKNSFDEFLDSEWYILGARLKDFESSYAKYIGTDYAVGVASGLDAMVLALDALGIKKGDEIIVPSNTYIATWLAVSKLGAIPIPVEPHEDFYNIDPQNIERAITEKTKAILAVNLYGQACEFDPIMDLCKKYNLFLIEDNAQAHGAMYKNKVTGSFGDAGAHSFYPTKPLGGLGDGGAITTNSFELSESIKVLRNYGSQKKYYNNVLGYNSRLDELQAAMLTVRMQHLNSFNEERKRIASYYNELLGGIKGLILPSIHPDATSVYHIYNIRLDRRDALQKFLEDQGIGTLIHYPVPAHLQKAYAHLNYTEGSFPIAEKLAKTSLSLPIYPGLDQKAIAYMAKKIKEFFKTI